MKKLLLLFILLISINSFSQMDELLSNEWFLAKVEIENEDFYPPSSEINSFSVFTETGSSITICNLISLEYTDLSDFDFMLTGFSTTLEQCIDQPGLDDFEAAFSSLFWFSENQVFQYTIETDSEWNHIKTLIITNPEGNKAYFGNNALSTEELSKNKISIYPNPVKEKLTIENKNSNISNVQIVDTNGKLILNQKINSDKTEINFAAYPKGIYFIQFESEGKIIKIEKIIKN